MKVIKVAAVILFGLLATNPEAQALFGIGEPPILVSQRPSVMGMGIVLTITNASDETLHQVTVGATNHEKNEELKDVIVAVTLKPHESIHVGWMELNLNWAFVPGEDVRVGAAGYSSYVRDRI